MAEQSISQEFRFKFFTWRNRAKLIDEQIAQNGLCNSK